MESAINYYEHHLGDYAKDTSHLTMLEHGAYRLLLDRYYGTEQGIPADQAQRVARARTREEKAAVDAVLGEFFTLRDGSWINQRAEDEIASYYAKKPAAEEKRENAKERQRKSRERRKAIFEELSCHGVHLPWNATTEHAQAELSRIKAHSVTYAVTKPVTPVTRDNTATQTPVPSPQTPEGIAHGLPTSTVGTPAGAVCARLKSEALIVDVNPSHPTLLALLQAGLTGDEMVAAGIEAKRKGKGFGYALAVAEGRRRDAAKIAPLPDAPRHCAALPAFGAPLTKAGRATAEACARWLQSEGESA